MIGYAMCGSFCTVQKSIKQLENLKNKGFEIQPFMSEILYSTDTRFGKCLDVNNQVEKICEKEIIHTIVEAEPYGPFKKLDALVIAPCTGNTLAKLACGITDNCVSMVAKAHLRSNNPLLIALATNDALSANLQNIAAMLSKKHVYFVPMSQDDPIKKPHSLVANFDLISIALENSMQGKQMEKIII